MKNHQEIREERIRQARLLKKGWREWREERKDTEEDSETSEGEEEEAEPVEDDEALTPGPDWAEPLGQGNSSFLQEGAYEEILPQESIAPCDASHLADLGGKGGETSQLKKRRRMKSSQTEVMPHMC